MSNSWIGFVIMVLWLVIAVLQIVVIDTLMKQNNSLLDRLDNLLNVKLEEKESDNKHYKK